MCPGEKGRLIVTDMTNDLNGDLPGAVQYDPFRQIEIYNFCCKMRNNIAYSLNTTKSSNISLLSTQLELPSLLAFS